MLSHYMLRMSSGVSLKRINKTNTERLIVDADVDLKTGCVDSEIQLLHRLEDRNSVSSAGVLGVQECAPLQRTALC